MSANTPVLPIGAGVLVRALASVLALVTYWLKELMRARRNRRQASLLAGLDRRTLADIRHQPRRCERRFLRAVLGRPDRAVARARHRTPPEPRRERLPPAIDQPAGAPQRVTRKQ